MYLKEYLSSVVIKYCDYLLCFSAEMMAIYPRYYQKYRYWVLYREGGGGELLNSIAFTVKDHYHDYYTHIAAPTIINDNWKYYVKYLLTIIFIC